MPDAPALTRRPEWEALKRHHAQVSQAHLRDLFAEDPGAASA